MFWLWQLVVLLVDTRQVRWDPCRSIIISSSYSLRTWRWRWHIPPKCQYALPYHTLPQHRRPKNSATAVECWTVLRTFLHAESRFFSKPAQHWFSDKQFPCLSCLRVVFRLLARGLHFGSGKIFCTNRRAVYSTHRTMYSFVWLKDTKSFLSSSYLRSRRRTSYYGLYILTAVLIKLRHWTLVYFNP